MQYPPTDRSGRIPQERNYSRIVESKTIVKLNPIVERTISIVKRTTQYRILLTYCVFYPSTETKDPTASLFPRFA